MIILYKYTGWESIREEEKELEPQGPMGHKLVINVFQLGTMKKT